MQHVPAALAAAMVGLALLAGYDEHCLRLPGHTKRCRWLAPSWLERRLGDQGLEASNRSQPWQRHEKVLHAPRQAVFAYALLELEPGHLRNDAGLHGWGAEASFLFSLLGRAELTWPIGGEWVV
jgi:hypothetical protein